MSRPYGGEHDPPTAPLPAGAARVRETHRPRPPAELDDDGDEIPARTGPPARDHHRRPPAARPGVLLVPLLAGAVVAVSIGAYGRLHQATGYAVNLAGFSSAGYVKAWLGSLAVSLGIVQMVSAKFMYRPARGDRLPTLHRWSGRLAVLVSVPVAMHCLYALGFQYDSTRVWLHSLAGCLFFGAFTTKMLSLSREGVPRWAVPLLGGLVFALLVVLWLTSALWLFSRQGVHL